MRFSDLAVYLEKLERTTSRNEMTALLAGALKAADSAEIDKMCYLLLGQLLPAYHGIEFNIAEKTMIQALALAYGRPGGEIARLYQARGDLGDVAYELALRHHRRAERPSVMAVYDRMLEIAHESGPGSQERKVRRMADFLAGLDARSVKFVARIPVGKLRLGFSEATLLDALSMMQKGDKSGRPIIEQGYNVTADIGAIAKRVKVRGLAGLEKLVPEPGVPIRPALAERLRDAGEAIAKAGPEVGVEPKLDGFRTQIHISTAKGGKQVKLFSRNLENTTAMFPEIVAAAGKLPVKSVILDGETIGYNPKSGRFASFQETVQRKRKYDIEAFAKKIPLSVFVFDVLYLDGGSLLEFPFRQRRKVLEKILGRGHGAIHMAEQKVTADPSVVESELAASVAKGLEGLVVKNLALPYQAGSRGFHWVKLKATTAALEKLRAGEREKKVRLPDTVDCLVMGAYKGRGKRTAFGVGGFLLGIRGADDRYYSISRLGTGLSDEQFREARGRVNKLKVAESPAQYVVDKDAAPDMWVQPSLVMEILADEITLSPRHTAGRKGEGERGYSLRFPRLVRLRDDKNAEDATTVAEIAKMFKAQKKK